MRKIQIYMIVFFYLLTSSICVNGASLDKTKTILRHIITKIEWDDVNKRIVVHKIVIQKYGTEPIRTYPSELVVSGDSFQNETLTDNEAEQFVREHEPQVFKSDIVFGRTVEVFKDLSQVKDISEAEIDKWVKLAQKQVEQDYQNPPKNIKEDTKPQESNYQAGNYVYAVVFLIILFFFVSYYIKKHKRKNSK